MMNTDLMFNNFVQRGLLIENAWDFYGGCQPCDETVLEKHLATRKKNKRQNGNDR